MVLANHLRRTGALCVVIISLFGIPSASAQHQVLMNRLCKSWSLTTIQNITRQTAETAPANFILNIKPDYTMEQGILPDGIIQSTWSFNEANMILTVSDIKTKMNYELKILRITNEELELQDNTTGEQIIIHYKASTD
jgi:hypothetical protein